MGGRGHRTRPRGAVLGGVVALWVVALGIAVGAVLTYRYSSSDSCAAANCPAASGASSAARPASDSTRTPGYPPDLSNYPSAASTGVPTGTQLSPYDGPMIVTQPGTVIDGKMINGDLRIEAADVIVKNSQVNGDVRIDPADAGDGYSLLVQDSTVDAGDALGHNAYDGTGIGAVDFTAIRVEVTGGKLSINCFLDCTVQDSWLHGQATDSTGVQHEGAVRIGAKSTIVHNTLTCDAMNVPPEAGCSGDLTGYGDFAAVQNDLIIDNYLTTITTGGGVCAYGGSSGGRPFAKDAENIVFHNNVFGRGTKNDHGEPDCAYYFAVADFDTAAPGNQFTGNLYTDGTAVVP